MPRASFTQISKPSDTFDRANPEHARQSRSARRHHGTRYVAGCMTGTSIDALDGALVAIDGTGMEMRLELLGQVTWPLGALAEPLRRLANQEPMSARDIATLARDFAVLHGDAIDELKGRSELSLIAVHGQTVFHAPPVSWQLFNPAPLAARFKVPVVCDLRAADLAAGGEGAPITPLADYLIFRHPRERRTIVNLGGFCNITRLPAGEGLSGLTGADICACNQVLDAIARRVLDCAYDRDGQRALAGTAKTRPAAALATMLEAQAKAKRSLGTGDELGAWIGQHQVLSPEDLARTACAAIAQVIVRHLGPSDRIILAGGGIRNRALLTEIRNQTRIPIIISDEANVPASLREAMAIAVLGALCQDRVPITIPRITGVERAPVAGMWVLP